MVDDQKDLENTGPVVPPKHGQIGSDETQYGLVDENPETREEQEEEIPGGIIGRGTYRVGGLSAGPPHTIGGDAPIVTGEEETTAENAESLPGREVPAPQTDQEKKRAA